MRVLSTSKNAPAAGSGMGGGACSTLAAAADASPASAARSLRNGLIHALGAHSAW